MKSLLAPRTDRNARRRAFTLIEIMVTMTIIVILLAISLPVFHRVRENARDTQCRANLRQLGTGIQQYATRMGYYSSGTWDWRRDGAVTEVGWVADLVRQGTPVADLLCPSSQLQISKVYAELLSVDPTANTCADSIGGKDQTLPDGTVVVNPCRAIGLATSAEAKMTLIRDLLFTKGYNTNYAASWFLVRGEVVLDDVGSLVNSKAGCSTNVRERSCTTGPLPLAKITNGKAPANTIPMLGCASIAEQPEHMLNVQLDEQHLSGSFLADSYSLGPRDPATLKAPVVTGSGTGIKRWFGAWNTAVQDYRAFGPQHYGQTSGNILMFDGSVQSFIDANGDKFFNNGFPASSVTGFTSDEVELPEAMVYSRWSLDKARVR
ncbi:MAG: DUF1559 domain-containing protein [Pirellulales bacterium]